MKSFKSTLLVSVAAGAAVLAGSLVAPAPVAAETKLLAHAFMPRKHPLHVGVWETLQKSIPEATQGRVTVELSAGALGPSNRGWNLATSGVVDLSFIHVGFERKRLLLPAMGQLPFGTPSAEKVSVAMWRTYKKFFEKANEFKGVKLLTFVSYTGDQVFTAKRQVTKIEHFKGLKLRTSAGFGKRLIELTGATAVPSRGSEIFPMVSKGVVDGLTTTSSSLNTYKVTKYLKFGTRFPGSLNNLVWPFFMNQKKWDGISKADQIAIDKIAGENLARIGGQAWDKQNEAGRELLKGKIKITLASAELVAELRKRLKPLETDWFKAAAKRNVDGPAALAFFRAQAPIK